jgi:competence protein ComGC
MNKQVDQDCVIEFVRTFTMVDMMIVFAGICSGALLAVAVVSV